MSQSALKNGNKMHFTLNKRRIMEAPGHLPRRNFGILLKMLYEVQTYRIKHSSMEKPGQNNAKKFNFDYIANTKIKWSKKCHTNWYNFPIDFLK